MSFWPKCNVFVTGASGLLGSWLMDGLIERGANVTCLLRDWVPGSKFIASSAYAKSNVVRGELEDYTLLLRVINEYEIDTVFHLGAQTIVGTANRSPLSTFESNIRGTWNILEACRNCSSLIERVIVASSDKAYGSNDQLPYTENTPLVGRFPYDVSKSCADLIALSYYYSFELPVTITRCGNLFGGGDLNFNRLIPGTIRSALQNERPIVRSDGKYVRDYFYVRDAVEAYLDLAEVMPDTQYCGQAFNFGTETPVSVLDLVHLILRLLGKQNLEPEILNQAQQEIEKQYLDCSKAKRMLGWKPQHTMESGLQETIHWYKDYLSL